MIERRSRDLATGLLMALVLGSPFWQGCASATGTAEGVAAAPAASASEPAYRAQDFYPLALGNRWTYESSFSGPAGLRTVEIVGRDGAFFVDDSGAALTTDTQGVRDRRRYLLRDPVEEGHRWKSVTSMSAVEQFEIVAAGRVARVPAGRFEDCVVVRSQTRIDAGRAMTNEMTFAPGVGIVRIVTSIIESGRPAREQTRIELRDYQIAQSQSNEQVETVGGG